MKLSNIIYLYRARLQARLVLVQEGFALCGIAIGVALLFASQVASTSLSRSVTQLDREVVGGAQFQLDARGPDGFDERLLDKVKGVPGVRVALPVVEREVNVIGPNGRQVSIDLIGPDPRFTDLTDSVLQRLATQQFARLKAIALPAPLAQMIGAGSLQKIKIQVGDQVVSSLLGTALGEGEIGGLVNSPIALASIHYVQSLTGMNGRITRIFVSCEPGRERSVGAALSRIAQTGGVNLEPGDYDSRLFAVAVAPESESEELFSAISALVGFMFALNAMLITVPSRRRLIEEVRLQGATRSALMKILLFDAAVLGVLACVIGLALGELLSIVVFHATPGYLSFAFPVGNERIVTWQSVALAVGAGLIAAIVGVLWPLRDGLSRSLQGQDHAVGHRREWMVARLAVGFLCLALTTIIPVVHGQGEVVGNVLLVLALVCLLPLLFDGLVALFACAQRPFNSAASVLAVVQLQTPQTRVRSLAIAVTAAVAVFGVVEFQGIQRNLTNGLDAAARALDSGAQVWVTPSGEANTLATTPFKDIYAHTLSRLPGVATVGLYRGSLLDWGQRRLWVLAPPASSPQPIPTSQIVSGNRSLAATRVRQGGWAVLSQALASEHHLHIGQAFELPAPRPMSLRVAAISTNLNWPPGAIVMSATDYARAWESGDPSAYEIQVEPGTPIATVRSEVLHALGAGAGLAVETSSEREQRHYAVAAQGLSRLTQIRLLVLIAAVLAVAAAMSSMVWQRRDLIASMKVDGYRSGVLLRWLMCESAVLLVAGCLIGAVFGLYGEVLGSRFLTSVTGFPVVYNLQVSAALSSFGLVVIVAVAVTALPGYWVVRVPAGLVSPAYQ
jgi:putative ABC transport system permease protein